MKRTHLRPRIVPLLPKGSSKMPPVGTIRRRRNRGGSTSGSEERCCGDCRKRAILREKMVEAAGIEPASRDSSVETSTCIVFQLVLIRAGSERQDPAGTSPNSWSRRTAVGPSSTTSPLRSALRVPRAKTHRRWLSYAAIAN